MDSEPRIYQIVRFRYDGPRRVIKNNVTLTEAQAWCNDPETSSSTCSEATRKRRGGGKWFDGYDYMPGCRPREDR